MKHILFPLLFIALLVFQFSCTKDDQDTNTQQASTSTTSSQPVVTSSDQLIFGKDSIKQFNKSQLVVSNHFMLKATHITSDPVLNITLSDATFPATLPKNYTVTQSALSDGKCNMTFQYSGRFYNALSGSLKVSMLNGKKGYTLTNIQCLSVDDPQQRLLNGVLTTD